MYTGPSRKTPGKRARITNPERELVLRCYNEKNGQSWEDILEHVRDNLDSLPFSSPAVEFYMEKDSKQAINRMRRIISSEMKTSTTSESKDAVAGPMSDILSSKLRYAKKKNPEERYETKFAHLASGSSNHSSSPGPSDHSSSEEQRDVDVKSAKKGAKRKKPQAKGEKRSKGKSKAQDMHVAMCKKAMKTLDKVNMLLDKYADSSASSSTD